MSIDRTELKSVLLNDAETEIAERAMIALEPFVAKIETGLFPLTDSIAVANDQIRAAVELALKEEITLIDRISLSAGLFPKPDPVTVEFYRRCLHEYLLSDVARKIQSRLRELYGETLYKRGVFYYTEENFQRLLGEQLRCALKKAARQSEQHPKQWEDGWKEIFRAIQATLICYLSAARLNNTVVMTKLEPLVTIVHQNVPIGYKPYEPGTLIVFVA
ncbi:hypothetical protein KKF05_04750 [Patescibacteria group bacterium]|nr:hypothetical protein [Patescibacteria group bacterium]MBU1028763.1 hypothetical protein [Patescibacteria group bacterium]